MSKFNSNNPKPKPKKPSNRRSDRPGNHGRSEDAMPVVRGEFRSRAVATQLADMAEMVEAKFDALREREVEMEEKKADMPPDSPNPPPSDNNGGSNGGDSPGGDPDNMLVAVVPDYQPLKALPLACTQTLPQDLLQLIRGHFAAFGYTQKSLMSARSNALRWWSMCGKPAGGIDLVIDMIDREHYRRAYVLGFVRTLMDKFWDFIYDLQFNWKAYAVGLTVSAAAIWKVGTGNLKLAGMGVAVGISIKILLTKRHSTARQYKKLTLKDFCTGTNMNELPEIDKGAVVLCDERIQKPCTTTEFPIGFTFGREYLWIPRNCWHNELNAVVTRQLQPRVPFSEEGQKALDASLRDVIRFYGKINIPENRCDWMTIFLSKYPTKRRNQIAMAMQGMLFVDYRIDGFGKIEVSVGKPVAKRKVRLVSSFHDGYLSETGPEYYLWFKAVVRTLWGDETRYDMVYLYTGGLTADQVGEWFSRRIFEGDQFLLSDFSKFDSRIKPELAKALYTIYKNNLSDELYQHLEATFHKTGRTKKGIQFSVEATVGSGRIDTTGGNTTIVFMVVGAQVRYATPPNTPYKISALGDDSNTAIPGNVVVDVEKFKEMGYHLGHETEVVHIQPHEYHLLEFCSQRVWQVNSYDWVLGPKPGRLLAKTFVCHRKVPECYLLEHVAGIIQGLKYYRWIPLFRAVYHTFLQRHPKVVGKLFYGEDNPHKIHLRKEIDVDVRYVEDQFYAIYGFHAQELEDWIYTLPFEMGDCYEHPLMHRVLEIDGVAYDFNDRDYMEEFRQWDSTNTLEYFL